MDEDENTPDELTREQIDRLASFGRAKGHECGVKLSNNDKTIKLPDGKLVGMCRQHAILQMHDQEYSEEYEAAIEAMAKCTPEERHLLRRVIKDYHKVEKRDCNHCVEKKKDGGDNPLDLTVRDVLVGKSKPDTNCEQWTEAELDTLQR